MAMVNDDGAVPDVIPGMQSGACFDAVMSVHSSSCISKNRINSLYSSALMPMREFCILMSSLLAYVWLYARLRYACHASTTCMHVMHCHQALTMVHSISHLSNVQIVLVQNAHEHFKHMLCHASDAHALQHASTMTSRSFLFSCRPARLVHAKVAIMLRAYEEGV